MKVLQLVKYYAPSRGGMESVVKSIVEGVSLKNSRINFTVYANNHIPSYKSTRIHLSRINVIKEKTPFLFKSQPLSLRYQNLSQLIRSHDIIHHHYPFPNMEIALLRNEKLLSNKKLIITWHANIKNSRWSFIKKYYDPIIEKILKRADHIVVTSPQLLESSDILQKYSSKISVIPLSYDPTFDINKVLSKKIIPNQKKRVLFVGKLRSYKGINFLIDAISNLDVELTIVGDGEEELKLKNQVNSLNLSHRVAFLKNVSDQELILLYQSADLFVLPSINEAEAFGVVQLEAMANGLPVINTNLQSGVPFVSLNNISGFTVEPGNSIAIAEAIEKIFKDPDLYENFSFNSIKRAKSFAMENMSNSYIQLYNS